MIQEFEQFRNNLKEINPTITDNECIESYDQYLKNLNIGKKPTCITDIMINESRTCDVLKKRLNNLQKALYKELIPPNKQSVRNINLEPETILLIYQQNVDKTVNQ